MKSAQYAEALYEAARGKDEAASLALVDNLTRLLEQEGHQALLPQIAREYHKIERMRSTSTAATVRVATEAHMQQYRTGIEADAQALGTSREACTVVVDDTVIGGYALEAHGKRIDRTHKRALLELYSKLITSAQNV